MIVDHFTIEQLQHVDLLVVGSGFYGLTVAEQAAADGHRVGIIERRDHPGGNAWSSPDSVTGIEVHRYGSHIFHTSNTAVWEYVNQFAKFNDYRHRVWTVHDGRVYPMPISLATINQFFEVHLSPQEARHLVASQSVDTPSRAANFEEKAISLIGRPLYEAFIRGYTLKQWQTDPTELPASVISRLPVRYTYNTRYFSDEWEGIPVEGYGRLLESMAAAPEIALWLGVDWFEIRDRVPKGVPIVYTGPVDQFFDYCAGRLAWRTLDLHTEVLEVPDYQGTAVVNYADEDVAHTRIHEFRHYDPARPSLDTHTVIMTEYSRWAAQNDEPYYPVSRSQDREMLSAYRKLADREALIFFGGRLGTYAYLDMHAAIASALGAYRATIRPAIEEAKVRNL
jgi:UDP-galactopyranose mutase